MAASPKYKVYSPDEEYVASFKYLDDAAAFVAFRGDGATVRLGHTKKSILWTEGSEEISAAESYDVASGTMGLREMSMRS